MRLMPREGRTPYRDPCQYHRLQGHPEASLRWGLCSDLQHLDVAPQPRAKMSRTMLSAVSMRRASWLQSSSLSSEVQQFIQDLPFNGAGLFTKQTDTKLHSLKDSRPTLCSLDLYTLFTSRTHFRPQEPQRFGGQSRIEPYRKKNTDYKKSQGQAPAAASQSGLSRYPSGGRQAF